MEKAVAQASEAAAAGEVPVGAVVVRGGEIVGEGRNRIVERGTATAHAEILALIDATEKIGARELTGCTLYVTLEPCPMCAYAAVLSRVDRIVFGAYDPKAGACGSIVNVPAEPRFNHHPEVIGGVMEVECGALLAAFFELLRRAD
ncbi:MAG: nucleoside deaminase [Candidatus Coatesbacteria bacterium]|nr:MAG: nucleoside deaminase [Candidatus Coatesbacteria bacterium]